MNKKLIGFYIIIGIILLQFQNCAQTSESFDQELEQHAVVDGIDRVNPGQISFPQAKVSAYVNESFQVSGVCDQSGAWISWKLENEQKEVIERGLAECDLGSFEVALSDQWQSFCDQDLMLKAALGAKASSETAVETHCD